MGFGYCTLGFVRTSEQCIGGDGAGGEGSILRISLPSDITKLLLSQRNLHFYQAMILSHSRRRRGSAKVRDGVMRRYHHRQT